MKRKVFYSTLACLAICTGAYAQDGATATHTIGLTVPEFAIIDLESATSNNISFTLLAPAEAGNPMTVPTINTNSSIWLNYSTIVSAAKKITVSLGSTSLDGVTISLLAGAASATGGGDKGDPGSLLTLDGTTQDLITGIGSSYTGNGINNGHQLTYTIALNKLGVQGYEDYVPSTTGSATVTYTISN